MMCCGCWKDYGAPTIENEKTRAAAKLIVELYKHAPVGGNFHIALDDWNVEDGHLIFCAEESAKAVPDENNTAEQLEIEKRLGPMLLAMTYEERVSALAKIDNCF